MANYLFPVGSHVVLQGLQEDASQYNGKVAIVESIVVGERQRVRLLDENDDIDDEDEQEEGKILDVRPENLKATFYRIGSHVVLHGLQAASHHNEKIAIVESTVGERQRVRLLLLSNSSNDDESKFLDVKPENLKQVKFYPTGSRVILHGLQAASYYKYNGKIAVVESSSTVGGGERQRVRLMNNDDEDDDDNNNEGKVLDVRPRNLKANFHSIGIHVILHGLQASREQYNGKIGVVESTVGKRQRVRLLDDNDDGNVSNSKVLNVFPENLKANVYPIQSRVILQGLQGTLTYKYNGKVAIVESTVGERQRVRLLLDENDKKDNIVVLHVWPENLKLAPQITETTAKQNLENIIKEQQQQQQQEEEKKNKKQKTKQPSRSTKQATNKSNDDDCTECFEGICCCLCAILGVAALVLAADNAKSPEPLPMPVRESTTPTSSHSFYSGLRPVSSGYTPSPPYSQSMDRGTFSGGTHAAHISQSHRQAAEEARAQEALRQAEAQYEETMRQCEFMNRATASASRMASSHSMNIADQMRASRQQHASRMMNDMDRDQQATWDRIHGTRTGGRSSGQASWDRINDTINTMNPNVVYSHTYTSDL